MKTFTFPPPQIHLICIVVGCSLSLAFWRHRDGEFQMNWSSFYFLSPKNFSPRKKFCFHPAQNVSSLKIDLSRVRIVIAMIHQKHFSNLDSFAALFFLSTGIFFRRCCWEGEHCWVNKVVGFFEINLLCLWSRWMKRGRRWQLIYIFINQIKIHIRLITLHASCFVCMTRKPFKLHSNYFSRRHVTFLYRGFWWQVTVKEIEKVFWFYLFESFIRMKIKLLKAN